MIISDLNYFEEATEASNVNGGGDITVSVLGSTNTVSQANALTAGTYLKDFDSYNTSDISANVRAKIKIHA